MKLPVACGARSLSAWRYAATDVVLRDMYVVHTLRRG